MTTLRVYVAGKVSKNSSFGTEYWRDEFVDRLASMTGYELINLDPTKEDSHIDEPELIFGKDVDLIKKSDVFIVYLSDDISVGGSQEILIAKYFNKVVIALAPEGGKFNGSKREIFGRKIDDYKDPFVFTTCDVVCGDIESVARALKELGKIKPKNMSIIDDAYSRFNRLK